MSGKLRVIGGTLRSRQFHVPARGVRPTADRVREALFSALGDVVDGAVVLDLFAGSGALGIEALSRGAARATFVERDTQTRKTLDDNLRALSLFDRCSVVGTDAERALERTCGPGEFSVVFVDPPYDTLLSTSLVAGLERVVQPNGIVVVERDARDDPRMTFPASVWSCEWARVYGTTGVYFFYANTFDDGERTQVGAI